MLALVVVLVTATAALGSAESDRAAGQRRANEAAARLNRAEVELARLEDGLSAVEGRVRAIRERTGALREGVSRYAVNSYVGDRGDITRFLVMDDATEFARAQVFADVAIGNSRDALGRFRAEREDLEAEMEALEKSQEARQAGLAQLRRRRVEAAAEVERLARLEREAQARAAAADAKARARAARPGAPKAAAPAATPAAVAVPAGAGWVCPVQGPHAFSNDYGARRGGGRSHQGNDLLAPRGTPVVANVAGTVSRHPNRLGGLAYYLKGDDGVTYYGAHLDSFGAQGRVSAGTVIGTVGNTGDAVGGPPHLHFEMNPGGRGPINPYPTLVKYC